MIGTMIEYCRASSNQALQYSIMVPITVRDDQVEIGWKGAAGREYEGRL